MTRASARDGMGGKFVSEVGELRTKALTDWVTSELFLIAFK